MNDLKKQIQVGVDIYKAGNLIKAEEIARKLLIKNPKVAFLYNFLGIVLVEQNKITEAIEFYKKGLNIDPNFALIYNNLALIFFKQNSTIKGKKHLIEKAEKLYKKSIALDKKNPEPLTNLGNLYNSINKNEEAVKYHKMAIDVNPKFFYTYLNLANVYVAIGNFTEAKKYLNESIKINNNFTHAHRLLSRLTKYAKSNSHLLELKKLYENTDDKKIEDKMNLAFALGKANEDINNFNKSFIYYKDANLLYRKKIVYSYEKEKEKFYEIKRTYDKKLFNKIKNNGCLDKGPIFIVGMPRSGTTLVEQILSSHSKVFGADEVEFIPNLIKEYFGNSNINLFLQGVFDFDDNIIKKMGEAYVGAISEISNNSLKTTDKLPENFLKIGLIKLILPKSKIVHCYRNSKDNIFSIFKNHFPGGKINYAYNLTEIIEYYKLYFDLMKYWNEILPDFIINIKYENLISSTEAEVKNLLNFCDLEWEIDCLDFYKNKRPIKTASDTQVRNKIYNSSIDSWKNYEKFLNEHYVNLKI